MDIRQLRPVSDRMRQRNRTSALCATRMPTCSFAAKVEPETQNRVALTACLTDDLPLFTFSFSRFSMNSTSQSSTRVAPLARFLDMYANVIGVTHELMAAPLQLPVEVVEHDVGQER